MPNVGKGKNNETQIDIITTFSVYQGAIDFDYLTIDYDSIFIIIAVISDGP